MEVKSGSYAPRDVGHPNSNSLNIAAHPIQQDMKCDCQGISSISSCENFTSASVYQAWSDQLQQQFDDDIYAEFRNCAERDAALGSTTGLDCLVKFLAAYLSSELDPVLYKELEQLALKFQDYLSYELGISCLFQVLAGLWQAEEGPAADEDAQAQHSAASPDHAGYAEESRAGENAHTILGTDSQPDQAIQAATTDPVIMQAQSCAGLDWPQHTQQADSIPSPIRDAAVKASLASSIHHAVSAAVTRVQDTAEQAGYSSADAHVYVQSTMLYSTNLVKAYNSVPSHCDAPCDEDADEDVFDMDVDHLVFGMVDTLDFEEARPSTSKGSDAGQAVQTAKDTHSGSQSATSACERYGFPDVNNICYGSFGTLAGSSIPSQAQHVHCNDSFDPSTVFGGSLDARNIRYGSFDTGQSGYGSFGSSSHHHERKHDTTSQFGTTLPTNLNGWSIAGDTTNKAVTQHSWLAIGNSLSQIQEETYKLVLTSNIADQLQQQEASRGGDCLPAKQLHRFDKSPMLVQPFVPQHLPTINTLVGQTSHRQGADSIARALQLGHIGDITTTSTDCTSNNTEAGSGQDSDSSASSESRGQTSVACNSSTNGDSTCTPTSADQCMLEDHLLCMSSDGEGPCSQAQQAQHVPEHDTAGHDAEHADGDWDPAWYDQGHEHQGYDGQAEYTDEQQQEWYAWFRESYMPGLPADCDVTVDSEVLNQYMWWLWASAGYGEEHTDADTAARTCTCNSDNSSSLDTSALLGTSVDAAMSATPSNFCTACWYKQYATPGWAEESDQLGEDGGHGGAAAKNGKRNAKLAVGSAPSSTGAACMKSRKQKQKQAPRRPMPTSMVPLSCYIKVSNKSKLSSSGSSSSKTAAILDTLTPTPSATTAAAASSTGGKRASDGAGLGSLSGHGKSILDEKPPRIPTKKSVSTISISATGTPSGKADLLQQSVNSSSGSDTQQGQLGASSTAGKSSRRRRRGGSSKPDLLHVGSVDTACSLDVSIYAGAVKLPAKYADTVIPAAAFDAWEAKPCHMEAGMAFSLPTRLGDLLGD